MARYSLISDRKMNRVAANHGKTQARLSSETERIAARGRGILAAHKVSGATTITAERIKNMKFGSVDHFVLMEDRAGQAAANAIEFGHAPGGWYAEMEGAKRVQGIYVLHRAAGLI